MPDSSEVLQSYPIENVIDEDNAFVFLWMLIPKNLGNDCMQSA